MVLDTQADYPLKDKIVLVTGGGSGISLAFAKIAHSLGAKLIIGDLKLTDEANAWVKEVNNERVLFQPTDVIDWKQLQRLITVSVDKYGDVPDVYLAGAGVFEPAFSNFWDDPEDTSYAEININVAHPIKLTRIAIRSLLGKGKSGTVLSIASVGGLMGSYVAPLYCATKHAIVGFTKSLADAERLEGIRVLTICPGYVHTPLWTLRPEAMASYSYDATNALLPIDVAERLIELAQQAKYKGGTVLETTIGGDRIIPEWNIDPPKVLAKPVEDGTTTVASGIVLDTVGEKLQKERGVLK